MSNRTKAFVNFYAAMGTMQTYVKLDKNAKELAAKQDISLRFKVKGGPDGVLVFNEGAIKAVPYVEGFETDIVLLCQSPEKFNDVVDGKATPIPIKGFLKLGFVLKKDSAFNILTTKMSEIMRKKDFDDPEERKLSTLLAFDAMVSAICQIGNEDEIGKMSASRIPNGDISFEIKDTYYATIRVTDKKEKNLEFINEKSHNARCKMVFDSLDTAKGLIDGKLDALGCVSNGAKAMSGYIPRIQNINNILNLVPKYLS